MPPRLQSLELKLPPLALTALTALLMWIVSAARPSYVPLSTPLALLSAALAALALGFVATGVLSFRKHQTTVDPFHPPDTTLVVTEGIYSLTRNPMYLGFGLALGAWAISLTSVLSALLLPLFIAYLDRFQVQPEERALLAKFGTPYEQYMARVRRWL